MLDPSEGPIPRPTTCVLFGAERAQWTHEDLSSLQSELLQSSRLKFLTQTLIELPILWSRLENLYEPFRSHGRQSVQQCSEFASGQSIPDPQKLGNIHLAPLTIVEHVVHFLRLKNVVQDGPAIDQTLRLPGLQAVQGLCIGLLSATAISSSSTWTDFERNVSNALHLAVCIGAIVDIEDALHDPSDRAVVISVRWKTHSDRAFLDAALDITSTAYVSCVTDEKTITVTVPSRNERLLCSQFAKANIASKHIGINGSFHHRRHSEAVEVLKSLCAEVNEIRLPDADKLRLPLRSTADAEPIKTGALHDVLLDAILSKRAHWFQTVRATLTESANGNDVSLIPVGRESFVPRSLSLDKSIFTNSVLRPEPNIDGSEMHDTSMRESEVAEEVAIVGMACRFPQADSVEEFWDLISSGGTAFGKMPLERFNPAEISREPKLKNFWGNFLQNPDLFDHRFFGVSGREAKSMDPQQRLALQVAYEALESAGYCNLPSKKCASDVGCYLGVGSVEYEDNVASENASAFSALGTLRAFISGRISHFFGWTGPSIVFDTACSSSAVAIHTACKALLAGECSMALAGGVNVMTSPNLYQNLSAASFLNPNGASRAFDANANGYCRGEGAGLVLLKPLSKAIGDRDQILGVVAGSVVNQGSNCTPITVPDSQSQTKLYDQALLISGIEPKDVTYVEAHGTGTPVGDPIEYDSVRSAFMGPSRSKELFLGAVKDNIGHAEGASGAAGLIKSILMMQHKTIPKQANFETLSPRIKISDSDMIIVPKETQPWITQRRVALVNNYGAAGSNAAIVLREHLGDSSSQQTSSEESRQPPPAVYPFLFSAKSESSLCAYMAALKSYIRELRVPLSTLAYNIARKRNPSLECRIAFAASDLTNMTCRLENVHAISADTMKCRERPPVVLCFGGQTSRSVSLSRELYNACDLLQSHLNECESSCQALGLPSIFPSIFEEGTTENLVLLHCMLLSVQYSSAKCWLDCGIEVDTVIGHSFGQFTALCVAGSISLMDALRLVSTRARLLQDTLGDHGLMLAVECEREDIESAVKSVNAYAGARIDFACYNGPRSFVLAGNTPSIEKLEQKCSSAGATRFKKRRLQTSQAYHSYLVDGVLSELGRVAQSMEIKDPQIPVETCSENANWVQFTAEEIVQHTRRPVFFMDAVERIAARLPSAIWLEAGSASPIIMMSRQIIASQSQCDHVFLPINVGVSEATSNLAHVACQLWEAGSGCQYWLFHQTQGREHTSLNLPPYQFEKVRHWIQYRPKSNSHLDKSHGNSDKGDTDLVNLVNNDIPREALFSVNTSNPTFSLATRGHTVAGQSLCPASMYIELASRCAAGISGGISGKLPQVEELKMLVPLGPSEGANVLIRLYNISEQVWDFTVLSHPHGERAETEHATGRITLTPSNDPILASRLKLLRRMARNSNSEQRTKSSLAKGVSGPMVYKVFMDVVEYADYYRGVKSLSGLDNEAVGFVTVPNDHFSNLDSGVCDPIALDNFLQVAGIHVNCLLNRKSDEVFMCTSIEEIVLTMPYIDNKAESHSYTVYSRCQPTSSANILNDIFVYDTDSKGMVLTILGAEFRSVAFKSVARNLARLKNVKTATSPIINDQADSAYQTASPATPDKEETLNSSISSTSIETLAQAQEMQSKVCEMLSSVIEIPLKEIEPTSTLESLGVDSLLVAEVLGEIKKSFDVNLTPDEFQEFNDVNALTRGIQSASINETPESLNKENLPIRADYKNGSVDANIQNSRVGIVQNPPVDTIRKPRAYTNLNDGYQGQRSFADVSQKAFRSIRTNYDEYAACTGFNGFCGEVLPYQSTLVAHYVVEAFASLGCDLRVMKPGDQVPEIKHSLRHKKLVPQVYRILEAAGTITRQDEGFSRTTIPTSEVPASVLHSAMLERFPRHTSETKLLHATAHRLADCISGTTDPLTLIFKDATARSLLEDVYTNAPMFKAGTLLLAQYLSDVLESYRGGGEVRILELGAGTGGTTKHLLEKLAGGKHNFSYTFTDLSSSLVGAAKRKFSKYPFMHYAVLDVEKDPEPDFIAAFDVVISTNCIHATKDLVLSTTNIRKMLRANGILCLIELTRNLFWFDLVFGLLEGWWLFSDDREHVLADEQRWKRCLHAAGFQWVDWSDSNSEESHIVRLITASPCNAVRSDIPSIEDNTATNGRLSQETLTFKQVGGLDLKADIFYPSETVDTHKCLPIALMIHGGGHIMLSRNDVRPEQTKMLLQHGFLPISIDYRLCPETTLPEGPMADVVDALAWIRTILPKLSLKRDDVHIDPANVVCVGWSTGGHLAMTLAWTSLPKGIQPPNAILAFYCPTDYEDPFWTQPNTVLGAETAAARHSHYAFDSTTFAAALSDRPITGYNVPYGKSCVGGWLAPSDPRSRIALYMNWHGRTMHVLLNGLDKRNCREPAAPSQEQIVAVSPMAQIQKGAYRTPTFIIHPRHDDLIPCEQSQRTVRGLQDKGIEADLGVVENGRHLFDVYPGYEANDGAREAVRKGYDFLAMHGKQSMSYNEGE